MTRDRHVPYEIDLALPLPKLALDAIVLSDGDEPYDLPASKEAELEAQIRATKNDEDFRGSFMSLYWVATVFRREGRSPRVALAILRAIGRCADELERAVLVETGNRDERMAETRRLLGQAPRRISPAEPRPAGSVRVHDLAPSGQGRGV